MLAPFHASVDPRLLDKVTRLFNSTLGEVCRELLQNTRRAGAFRVDVQEVEGDIVMRDDGRGIDDPRVLLTLGESRWSEATQHNEDPAGAGVFALSSRGAVIRSRSRDADKGWAMTLTPDHFAGKEPVTVIPCDMDPGTEITFARRDGEHVESVLQTSALHYPLPVSLNGQELDRKDFLAGAVHVETWRGLRIGVFRKSLCPTKPNINFHGLTLGADLPSVAEVMLNRSFSVRIDVERCPDLKLVLPARKEVVRDGFFEELKIEVKRVIYRAIARETSHFLPHRSWLEAASLGVELPEAFAALWPYEPDCADVDAAYRDAATPSPVTPDGCIVEFEDEPSAHQCFARATERSAPGLPLYERCCAYRGYAWYDELSLITGFRCLVTENGETVEVLLDDHAGERRRPDEITVEVVIRGAGEGRRLLSLATDLLVAGDSSCWSLSPAEVGLLVVKDSGIEPADLADFVEAAYFCPSDDACDDSYTTQQERFQDGALETATAFLLSEEEARLARLRNAFERDFLWLLPPDRETVITVTEGRVDVELRPFATGAGEGGAG